MLISSRLYCLFKFILLLLNLLYNMMAVVNHNTQSNLLHQCCIVLDQQSGLIYAHEIRLIIIKLRRRKQVFYIHTCIAI